MTLKAHLVHQPDPQALRALEEALCEGVSLSFGDEVGPDVHVLVSGRPGVQRLDASAQLRALVVPYAGIPPETLALLEERPQLAVHNLHHNAQAVAESAVSLLWAAAKAIVPMDRSLRQGDWRPRFEKDPAIILEGRNALVLGYGAIGRRVARLCQGIGLKVSAVRRRPVARDEDGTQIPDVADEGIALYGCDALHELLPDAQILMVCLPHTPQTDGLLNEKMLAKLPADTVLVNIARAAIIEERALFWALSTGHMHSAGLDVWYRYPKGEAARCNTAPSDHPFEALDNVVISPHRSGHAGDIERTRMQHLAVVLNAMALDQTVPNKVDCSLGY